MTTTLCINLILNLHASNAQLLKNTHGFRNTCWSTKTSIHIHQ